MLPVRDVIQFLFFAATSTAIIVGSHCGSTSKFYNHRLNIKSQYDKCTLYGYILQ